MLKTEQVSRNRLFFGDGGQTLIEGSFVVVVGLGGVGKPCCALLCYNYDHICDMRMV